MPEVWDEETSWDLPGVETAVLWAAIRREAGALLQDKTLKAVAEKNKDVAKALRQLRLALGTLPDLPHYPPLLMPEEADDRFLRSIGVDPAALKAADPATREAMVNEAWGRLGQGEIDQRFRAAGGDPDAAHPAKEASLRLRHRFASWWARQQVDQALKNVFLLREVAGLIGAPATPGQVLDRALRVRPPIPPSVRFAVFRRDDFTCQYCGRSAPEARLEIDHRVPVSRGGTNDISNLVTACSDCNRGKSNRYVT